MPLAKLRKKMSGGKGSKKKKVVKLKRKPLKKVSRKVKKTKKSSPEKVKKTSPAAVKLQEKEVGVITHYFGKIQVGIIKVKSPLALGDTIHIKGAHDDFTQSIDSMQYEHQPIGIAKKGLEIGIKVIKPVHENDRVYKAAE
jgi:putative protease